MSAESQAGGTVLAFLNEVAGGRKLLETVRARVDAGAEHVALAAPQNQPVAGQIVDVDEVRDAALSRVEVTQDVLQGFGIESTAAIFDPDPVLALDDAIRAYGPSEVLISALPETRYGMARKDLIEVARARYPMPIEHIPVRIEDDAVRWDVTHTLVVATQTVNAPDLVERLIARHRESPHRYTFVSPRLRRRSPREEVCDRLGRRRWRRSTSEDIDATGQPMSPEPFAAVKQRDRALPRRRHSHLYLRGPAARQWLEDGLIDQVKEHHRGSLSSTLESSGDGSDVDATDLGPAVRVSPLRRRPTSGARRLMESASVPRRRRARLTSHHHGPPEANASSKIDRQTLGILLFIVSEAMLFGAFFASYFFIRAVANPKVAPGRRSDTSCRSSPSRESTR